MSYRTRTQQIILTTALMLSLGACSDPGSEPVPDPSSPAVSGPSLSWNQITREIMVARAVSSPTTQVRILTYVSVAQYNAIIAAEGAATNASPASAAAAASAVVLKSFFPLDVTLIDDKLAAQNAVRWPGENNKDAAAGETIGRAIAAEVIAYAATDKTDLTTRPANPGGPGSWTGVNAARGFYESRTFALTSGDQFRPAAPPAFGSTEFNAALAEVRALSDGLTPAQLAEAQAWAPRTGAHMNGVAAALIVKYNRTEREAAYILALANMAAFDVANACFEAKFAYYFIRPSQADPLIKVPLGLPNHPSYPSGHSCFTAAYATVLTGSFPQESTSLAAMVEDAGMSRMYGGLHYRFDCKAGQELGRKVADYVMSVMGNGRTAIVLD